MRFNILIGGKAGQGINKVSQIVSDILTEQGYFTFNYRDYPSLIRGGHNFNILSISDKRVGSYESKLDGIVAMDEKTIVLHKNELKNNGFIIDFKEFDGLGRNLNIALAGALIKIFGIDKRILIDRIKKEFNNQEAISASEKGFNNKGKKIEHNFLVFQPENEIAVANAGLGASFAGAKTMIGSSGGGYDLMTEALSMQGISEIPLIVYLASRPGPGTGIPTYSTQADLDVALRAGHGEFPRIVIAPGDPIECTEKTNEAFYLSEKYGALSIILSDKHLAESEFSTDRKPNKIIPVEVKRKVPGEGIVKASSYEHDEYGNTTEIPAVAKKNADDRIRKYEKIKEEAKIFQMIKIYGNKNAKNLVISWGSNKTAILDAIDAIDESIENPSKGNWKFLQVLYMKPMSDEIKKEIENANKVILIEQNVTGQLGRLIREKTGIKIENRILKYDGKPFTSDELKKEIQKIK